MESLSLESGFGPLSSQRIVGIPLIRPTLFSVLAILLAFGGVAFSFPGAPAAQKGIRPVPNFVPGTKLRYDIETRTSSTQNTTTPVLNSEGASKYRQSTSLIVRLDVLPVAASHDSSEVRLRVTFEHARADSDTDAYAPEATALDDAIEKLEGQPFEVTLDSNRKISGVTGLDKITANRDVASRVLSWMHVLSSPIDLPADGVEVGRKWTAERPLTDVPLTGVIWRNESSYLRDEPCGASSPQKTRAAPAAETGTCAILLTHFEILRHGSEHSDATPQEYIRNGLRTSGKWKGSGESLDSVSLTSGFLVSSTQNATQNMDYQIASASSGSRIHHVGQTKTQTEITLLPSPGP